MSLGGHRFATPVSECAAAWSRSGPRASRRAGATSVWAGRQRRPGSTTGTVWKLAGHRKLCVLTLIRFHHVLREPQWEERSRAVRRGRSVREPRAQRGAWLATPAPETFVEPGMRERGGGALGTRTRVRSRGRAGAGVGAESDLLVELLYLLALVPSENTQQPFLGWRREWPRVPVGWRCSAPAPNPGLPRVAPPPPPRGQRTQPARGAPGRGVRGGREADELTSETTDGHCARLVVRVHSLKLREGHGVSAAARPGPAHSFPPRCAHLQASRHTAWQPRRSWTKAWCSS